MSCYIVEKNHIDYLVAYLETIQSWELYLEIKTLSEVGQILTDQNFKSVNHRYSEDTPTPKYIYKFKYFSFNPLQVMKSIKCYEYQSCETDNWDKTIAKGIVDFIMSRAISQATSSDSLEWGAPKPKENVIRIM